MGKGAEARRKHVWRSSSRTLKKQVRHRHAQVPLGATITNDKHEIENGEHERVDREILRLMM